MIIAICNTAMRSGCSSLAQALAVYLRTELVANTLLLDCCENQTSLKWAQCRDACGVTPIDCCDLANANEKGLNQLMIEYDHIVIDIDDFAAQSTKEVLAYADFVLISLRPRWQDMQQLNTIESFVDELTKQNTLQNVYLVLNLASRNEALTNKNKSAQALIRLHKLSVLNSMLHYYDFYPTLNENGLSIFDQFPKDISASEVRAVINEVLALSLSLKLPEGRAVAAKMQKSTG